MAFTDRVVEHPGRVKLTPVTGQTNVYDMTRDEGNEYTEGTLLNAANLNTQTQLDSAVQTKFSALETDTSFQNDMSNALNYLLESYTVQTSGNWAYIVLGKLFIGMCSFNGTLTIGTAVGSVYQTAANSTLTFPVTLSTVDYANVAISSNSYSVWTAIYSSSTSGLAYRAMSAASRASASYPIKVLVIGTI